MGLEVIWFKKGNLAFDTIVTYLTNEFGEIVASKFIKKVYDFTITISLQPNIGRIQNKELNVRGFVIVKQITIFYKIKNNKIFILNLYDNRQNPKNRKF